MTHVRGFPLALIPMNACFNTIVFPLKVTIYAVPPFDIHLSRSSRVVSLPFMSELLCLRTGSHTQSED